MKPLRFLTYTILVITFGHFVWFDCPIGWQTRCVILILFVLTAPSAWQHIWPNP